MYRQFCLKNVPTLLKYTEKRALKCTLFYEMYRKFWPKLAPTFMVKIQNNFFKKYTTFLKIYRIVTPKMLLILKNVHEIELDNNTHSGETYRKSSVKLCSTIKAILHNSPLSYPKYKKPKKQLHLNSIM